MKNSLQEDSCSVGGDVMIELHIDLHVALI
jgi:hypothetical protein